MIDGRPLEYRGAAFFWALARVTVGDAVEQVVIVLSQIFYILRAIVLVQSTGKPFDINVLAK